MSKKLTPAQIKSLEGLLTNPHVSEAHKAMARQQLEAMAGAGRIVFATMPKADKAAPKAKKATTNPKNQTSWPKNKTQLKEFLKKRGVGSKLWVESIYPHMNGESTISKIQGNGIFRKFIDKNTNEQKESFLDWDAQGAELNFFEDRFTIAIGNFNGAYYYEKPASKTAGGADPKLSPLSYFDPSKSENPQLIPMDRLRLTKDDPLEKREKAYNLMQKALGGTHPKRQPITVYEGDGVYHILDGNSTYYGAKKIGLTELYAEVVPSPIIKTEKAKLKDPKEYEGVFGDYDGDGILNVDDPHPTRAGDKETVEEVKLSDEITALIDRSNNAEQTRIKFVEKLKQVAEGETDIKSRTKTPFSIVNKMRRKMFSGPNGGLTDLVGGMVIFSTHQQVESFIKKVRGGAIGQVIEEDNYYENPKAGYMAFHFNLIFEGTPVELQIKSERLKKIAGYTHTLYKQGQHNANRQLQLSKMAVLADKGDAKAAEIIDSVLASKETTVAFLTGEGPDFNFKTTKEPKRKQPVTDRSKSFFEKKKQEKQARKVTLRQVTPEEKKTVEQLQREIRDYIYMTPAQVRSYAKRIQDLRPITAKMRDDKTTAAKVLPLTFEGLLRWAKNPGAYDLQGIDTKGNPDSNVKPRVPDEEKNLDKVTTPARSFWGRLFMGE